MRRKILAGAVGGWLLAGAFVAHALINVNFTPVNLVEKSELILLLKVKPADDKGKATAEVVQALKGKAPGKTVTIDLSKTAMTNHADAVKTMIAGMGDGPVLLFSGKGEKDEDLGALHLGGKWVTLEKSQDGGTWEMGEISSHLEGTWAGGTDMLLLVVRILLQHPDMSIPVDAGAAWDDQVQIGKIAGPVNRMMAVDIVGKGEIWLFAAADAGDRVYAWNKPAKKFQDQTAKLKLGSKSKVCAWGDFNGDGRLDLASWDGKALSVWSQGADGAFASAPVADAPDGKCVALQALDVGVKGKAGLVWGSAGPAVLLIPDKEKAGVFARKALTADAAALKAMGSCVQCLAADLDGDNICDVLQVGARGSVLYKGKGPADFAEGKACAVATGEGRADAFFGDWDADGKLDVFTTGSEDMCRLWQNGGDGKFADLLYISGEIAYIANSKPKAFTGNVCDYNNDGRQDVFIAYAEDNGPMIFFNRFFRSFGHAHQPIDITESTVLPEATKGVQAGVVADFTNDGAQDMALALLNGEIWVFPRTTDSGSTLGARVTLPPGGAYTGPVNVTGNNGIYSMGAWAVQPGVGEAFLTRSEPGPVTFTWQLPGGAVQKQKQDLEEKLVRFQIPQGK